MEAPCFTNQEDHPVLFFAKKVCPGSPLKESLRFAFDNMRHAKLIGVAKDASRNSLNGWAIPLPHAGKRRDDGTA